MLVLGGNGESLATTRRQEAIEFAESEDLINLHVRKEKKKKKKLTWCVESDDLV
jgi:hypothetical protein